MSTPIKRFLLAVILSFVVFNLFSQIPEGYYSGTDDLSGNALKSRLNDIIDNHTELSYDDLKWALRITDEDPSDTSKVICLYSGWSYGKYDFGNGSSEWNREHVWSKSHGDFGDYAPAGTDLHHLRPVDASVNSSKSNRDFGEGVEEYIDKSGATGCFKDTDIWEPRDAVKGDVARMVFYMAVRYEGEHGEPDLQMVDYVNTAENYEPYYGKISTLLAWHNLDPIDNWERTRNKKIYEIQGNRNPFIDHPEFADLIWNSDIKIQPSNHVKDFGANFIRLEWKDATGEFLPDGYLVRMSMESFDAIEDPLNGKFYNSSLDQNVAYGIESAIFNNLEKGKTYYFKVFSYTKTGELINYKVHGDVPFIKKNF